MINVKMKSTPNKSLSALHSVVLLVFALVLASCKREFDASEFHVLPLALRNSPTMVSMDLAAIGPRRAKDFTASWDTPQGTLTGTSITVESTDDFDVVLTITPDEDASPISITQRINVRALLAQGGTAVTDYRDALTGNYACLRNKSHYSDPVGLTYIGQTNATVSVAKADSTYPHNYIFLHTDDPLVDENLSIGSAGSTSFDVGNFLQITSATDSLELQILVGGMTSYDQYNFFGKR